MHLLLVHYDEETGRTLEARQTSGEDAIATWSELAEEAIKLAR